MNERKVVRNLFTKVVSDSVYEIGIFNLNTTYRREIPIHQSIGHADIMHGKQIMNPWIFRGQIRLLLNNIVYNLDAYLKIINELKEITQTVHNRFWLSHGTVIA